MAVAVCKPLETGPETTRLEVITRFEEIFSETVPALITPPVKLPIDTVFAVIEELPDTARLVIDTGDAVISKLPLEIIVVAPLPPPTPPATPVPAGAPFAIIVSAATTDAVYSEIRDI